MIEIPNGNPVNPPHRPLPLSDNAI